VVKTPGAACSALARTRVLLEADRSFSHRSSACSSCTQFTSYCKHDFFVASGGKLVIQYKKKQTKHPRCGASGVVLHGVSGWQRKQFAGQL
jgi:hypothetical protein